MNKANKNTVATVATVKADKTTKVAETATVATVESRVTLTKNTREMHETNGVGVNTFGSWVGRDNIMLSLVRMIALSYAIICDAVEAMGGESAGKLAVHTTLGCKGAHLGLCMVWEKVKFTDFAGVEREHTVFIKDNGAMYVDGLCEGFTYIAESELRLHALKVNDVRAVRLDSFDKAKGWTGEVVNAALLGSLQGRYQGLMFRDSSGVRVITRIFGETKEHETQRAVSVATLAGDAKEAAKRFIFDGIAETATKVAKAGKAASKVKADKVKASK